MQRFDEVPTASEDGVWDKEDKDTRKYELIMRLEKQGHKVIAIDRALMTVERCNSTDAHPVARHSALKIDVYDDPDLYGGEFGTPDSVYLYGSRWGLTDIFKNSRPAEVNDLNEKKIFSPKELREAIRYCAAEFRRNLPWGREDANGNYIDDPVYHELRSNLEKVVFSMEQYSGGLPENS